MEKLLRVCKKRAAIVFYIAFLIEIIILCLNNAGVNIPYRGRILQLAAIIFAIKVLLTNYTKKEWVYFAFFVVIGLIQFFCVRDTLTLEIVLMIFASKDIKQKKAITTYFYISLCAMILMIILSILGVCDNLAMIEDFNRGGVEKRYAFGFSHPNVFYSNLLFIVTIGIYVFFEKLKWWHYFALTIVNVGFYVLVASRTGVITVQLMIILAFAVHRFPQLMKSKLVYWLGYAEVLLAVVWSVWMVQWPSEFTWLFDRIMTGRIGLAQRNAALQTWTLFPNQIERGVLDMGYVYLFATMGIVLGSVYLGVMLAFYNKSYKQSNYIAVAVFIMYTIFTMVEAHAFSMYFVGNLMFILMIGWGKEQKNVSTEKSDS